MSTLPSHLYAVNQIMHASYLLYAVDSYNLCIGNDTYFSFIFLCNGCAFYSCDQNTNFTHFESLFPHPSSCTPALHPTPFYYPVPLHPPLVNLLLQPAPYPLPTFYTLYTPHPQTVLPLYPVLIICTSHPPPPTSQSLCVPPYPLNFSSSHQPIRVELFSNYQRERGRGEEVKAWG